MSAEVLTGLRRWSAGSATGLLHEWVTSDLWRREASLEGC
ncbi:MAG: hypothetical protein AVDCRST_MAG75-2287 [uncultured Propionibacteriaceae bacterium]|uniref:Uncharacterized protein n=1 Tax=uncultured Propionibacteriaceae bacterium TaxID=257457 RepID=A0A6J4P5S3_9ACTN|nr:MAG: hypothetical protein AVDCRST_MAG75-2287 [uncultured Propionibacteriaceae bacterium]